MKRGFSPSAFCDGVCPPFFQHTLFHGAEYLWNTGKKEEEEEEEGSFYFRSIGYPAFKNIKTCPCKHRQVQM